MTGDDLPVAMVENSLLTHTPPKLRSRYPPWESRDPTSGLRPASPKRSGITAVHPRATTRSAKPTTNGEMPGISVITSTTGPAPLRYTSCPKEPCSNRKRS